MRAATYMYGGSAETRNSYMVMDGVEGMTNGRGSPILNQSQMGPADFIWSLNKYQNGTHMADDRTYWYNGESLSMKQGAEAWAEYYSAIMTGNQDAINSNRYYFPETCAYFDTLAEEMLTHYQEKARGRR